MSAATPLDGDGPWLIRSHHWSAWHRKTVDPDGKEHATGYTDDVAKAGVFGRAAAQAYHSDWGRPGARDEAVPVSKAREDLVKRRDELRREAAALDAVIMGMGEGELQQRPATYQQRVNVWMRECFSFAVSIDMLERVDRHIEETLELAQALDYPPERIAVLTAYTYGRPKGVTGLDDHRQDPCEARHQGGGRDQRHGHRRRPAVTRPMVFSHCPACALVDAQNEAPTDSWAAGVGCSADGPTDGCEAVWLDPDTLQPVTMGVTCPCPRGSVP